MLLFAGEHRASCICFSSHHTHDMRLSHVLLRSPKFSALCTCGSPHALLLTHQRVLRLMLITCADPHAASTANTVMLTELRILNCAFLSTNAEV